MKRFYLSLFILLINVLSINAQSSPFSYQQIGNNLYKIDIGNNSVITSIGDDGVLLCDVGSERESEVIKKVLKELGAEKVDYIIDTHWHEDHCGGNINFGNEAVIIAHENVKKTLSKDIYLEFWNEEHPAYPGDALPDIVFTDRMSMHFNGEDIEMVHLPHGHTDGDIIVYFKKSNVVHVGDCIFSNGFPAIDFETGGTVKGFADNLTFIREMLPDDVKLITGHGPDFTIKDVQTYEEMIRSTLNIVQSAMQKGMAFEDMQKDNILDEWKSYSNGFFSCDDWISIIYHSLISQ